MLRLQQLDVRTKVRTHQVKAGTEKLMTSMKQPLRISIDRMKRELGGRKREDQPAFPCIDRIKIEVSRKYARSASGFSL